MTKYNNLIRNLKLQTARLREYPRRQRFFEGQPEPWSDLLDEAASALEELCGIRKYAWTPGSKFVYWYGLHLDAVVCHRTLLHSFVNHSAPKEAVLWPTDQELNHDELLLTYDEVIAAQNSLSGGSGV